MNKQQRILSRARANLGLDKYNDALRRRKEKGGMIFPNDTTVFSYIDKRKDNPESLKLD
jgi:hypothetical protein